MNTIDTETSKQLADGEEVKALIGSRGWGVIHGKLTEKILDLQNINNIDTTSPETLSTQLLGRKLASDLLFAWLQADVYGFVEQQEASADALIDKSSKEEGFVERS